MVKESILASLLKKLEEITVNQSDTKNEALLSTKTTEFCELDVGVKNESVNKESLLFMLNRLKEINITRLPVINKLRKKIQILDRKKANYEKKCFLAMSSTTAIEKSIAEEERLCLKLLSAKTTKISEKSNEYQEKYKLKLCIDQEKERNSLLAKQKIDIDKLRFIESKLGSFKDMELIQQEVLAIESYCAKEEEKFKTIQKVTNVRYIGDILDHYRYLMDNKKQLLDSVTMALAQIDRLDTDRVFLSEDLAELKYQTGEGKGLDSRDLEDIQQKFKDKERYIENYEAKLETLQKIIAFATNAFARVGKMLGIDKRLEIRKEHLLENMRICYETLTTIMQEILEEEEESGVSDSRSIELTLSAVSSNRTSVHFEG